MGNNKGIIYDNNLLDSLEEAFFSIKQMPNKLSEAIKLTPDLEYYSFDDSKNKIESLYTKIQKYEIDGIDKNFYEFQGKYNGYLEVMNLTIKGRSSVDDVNEYHMSFLVPWFEENIYNLVKSKVKANDTTNETSIVNSVKVYGVNYAPITTTTGNNNTINVNITTTNNKLKQLLQTFQQEANKVVEILPEKDKKEFTQLTNQIIQDANNGEKSSFFDYSVVRLETFNIVTGFVESLGKIAEFFG